MKFTFKFGLSLLAFMLVCSNSNANSNYLRMVSGPSGGSWYPLGAKIMHVMQNKIKRIITSNTYGGGISNIISVNNGDAEIGFTYAHTAAMAYNGKNKFYKDHKNIRYFASLYPAAFQVAVRADTNIKSFEDIKFANVSPGKPKWTGTAFNESILEEFGFNYNTIKNNGGTVYMVSYRDTVNLMKKGMADVFMAATSVPQASFIELENSPGIRFIGLPINRIDNIIKNNPGYIYGKIPASAYKSLNKDMPTLGIVASLIINKNLSDKLVYKMTKVFWENHFQFVKVRSVWKKVILKQALDGAAIPVHPGAAKYYQEQGVMFYANNLNKNKYMQNWTTISSEELKKEKQKSVDLQKKVNEEEIKRLELERRLAAIEKQQKQEQKIINSDNEIPTINAFSKLNGSNAVISGRVTDNTGIAELLVDDQVHKIKPDGTFETSFYIPRSGKNIIIVATDIKGNKASKILKLERGAIAQATGPSFEPLNPSLKKVKSNSNALALIIGVANYEKTTANALYADKDAQQFYDYATMKLGIPARNVKELVNNKADRVEIGLAIQDWIARSTKKGKSDIYIFFAGHGLASQDGKDMFLLPYDGSPRLLKASAIRRKELFANIKQANPRSVTVFLDTCYSGVTRNEEMLISGRPVVIKAKEQPIPDGFTLFSAASNEQISRTLEEAKHGMFSYFLMKGMEGDADANNDKKITALELHNYVRENVTQQSSGSQTPELLGDKDKVLIHFN